MICKHLHTNRNVDWSRERQEGREGGREQTTRLTHWSQSVWRNDTRYCPLLRLAARASAKNTMTNNQDSVKQTWKINTDVKHFQETTVIKHIWTRSVPGNYCNQTHLFQKTTIIRHIWTRPVWRPVQVFPLLFVWVWWLTKLNASMQDDVA